MEKIDLSTYGLGELKGLQHEIETAIKGRQNERIHKAREQILAIALGAGISVKDLLAHPPAKVTKDKRQKAVPKYQNPANRAQCWSGRGRQPRWIADGLANGKKLDDFWIKD